MTEKTFGSLKAVAQPPDLIEIQTQSFKEFIQADVPPQKRKPIGLEGIFREIFPIEGQEETDEQGHSKGPKYTLDYVNYTLGKPKCDYLTALANGESYTAPLEATFRLRGLDGDGVREEKVFMGDLPLMTQDGAFVINGAERVIVSQLHRSPGLCSERTVHPNGQDLFSVRIIPDRGSWIEIQFDAADIMWVYLDRRRRRRKFLVTTFLRVLGYGTDESIVRLFYTIKNLPTNRQLKEEQCESLVFKDDLIDIASSAVLARRYEPVTPTLVATAAAAGLRSIEVIDTSFDDGVLIKTLRADECHSAEDALKDIYHRLRPGDPASTTNSRQLIQRFFFDPRRYDLGKVGRYKINTRLNLNDRVPLDRRVLSDDGIEVVEALRLLLNIRTDRDKVDDIDHLGNRRVRTAGELLENQCRLGLSRTERLIRERMAVFDDKQGGTLTPTRLVNSKSLSAVIQDFFGRSQLSQFMDMTNPLSGLAHKRRLSALGPGGLSRERAGFEVRDVHPSHYGRICPIETPEGPNIGLISSLGIYARINEFGFIESPYRVVRDGRVTNEVHYLPADLEENYIIAQANVALDQEGRFVEETVSVRYKGDFKMMPSAQVNYMDVSPAQVISIAAALIPFLEHDDANRALMGANMMRQGVPLLKTDRPRVATGFEAVAAKDACVTVVSKEDGIVAYVDATQIIVSKNGKVPAAFNRRGVVAPVDDIEGAHRYRLQKFRRSNAGTCVNQRPIVRVGQQVKAGQTLADGPATDQGYLALGKNMLVAFMPWRGYNFEDAIVASERVVRDDVFTSIHINDFECVARDTKLGPEQITRDIPNVGEDMLKNLTADGVVRIGAEVRPGDILVGKITPKSETELAPEERLLRAIFGDKAADVRDTSLTVPSGVKGIVMDVKVTSSQGGEAPLPKVRAPKSQDDFEGDEEADLDSEGGEFGATHEIDLRDLEEERKRKRAQLESDLTADLSGVLLGEKTPLAVYDSNTGDVIIPANRKITKTLLSRLAQSYNHIQIEQSPVQEKIEKIIDKFRPKFEELENSDVAGLTAGLSDFIDEGVVKEVRVFIAEKKNLSVGDKLAGRHGNKGIVAKIVPDCDMPFLPDGRHVDLVLNPLGVPSRMNLGQLFETVLGMACRELDIYATTPIFDGCRESEIDDLLAKARRHQETSPNPGEVPWISPDGKSVVYDGRTGEPFDQRVVVGNIYMLKLHHLVTDKIHARATGPYSLVTQQPLGGKAQYGGQRMGEMEVWALEAYGVAYALQELLTVKSDDVAGRTRIYESIVKGQNILEANTPESFSVLLNELRGLCLDMNLLGDEVIRRQEAEAAAARIAAQEAADKAALSATLTDRF
ncbi:MAG: DNA-directed RNA polymerase subunit beta [Kiritimatiellia bacterium]|nr:DNA-directed RNA polymerase subunit beta [Kiritimatiellia bacterium]